MKELPIPIVCITNHSTMPLVITKDEGKKYPEGWTVYPYTKGIAQCIMVEVPRLEVEEISYEALQQFESERGTGKLGSSGK